ncbi:hypothetical protein MLD38_026580 [Melastoma candidum]|nr:hypothetical protein MLD38_026580 [Melastoma candidum]
MMKWHSDVMMTRFLIIVSMVVLPGIIVPLARMTAPISSFPTIRRMTLLQNGRLRCHNPASRHIVFPKLAPIKNGLSWTMPEVDTASVLDEED